MSMHALVTTSTRLLDTAIRVLEREQQERRIFNALQALRQLAG